MVFKAGYDENRNMDGRPEGSVSIVSAIKKKLKEEFPDATTKEKRTYLEAITQKIFDKGLAGDVSMLKDMVDRVDGKAKESIDIQSKGERIGAFNFIKPEDENNLSNDKTITETI